jgi:nucleotide-binding universal stress UspA family protein
MAYKDILVFLDPTTEAAERARFAASLAKSHGARLVGLDVSAAPAGKEVETEAAVARMFADATGQAAPAAALIGPTDKAGDGEFLSYCVDLMIAPGPESLAHASIRPGALDRALLESGVPMLILPPDWTPGPVGDNIVIAWNAGREAMRAVHDAMPLLERAKKVTLFAFSSRPSGLRKSAEILADHLAAHGVKTEHISDWTNTGDLTAVEALFASLDTQDADLIVAGAFGHSKLYEGVFGGVTMDLLHQQSLPVLMSH